MVYRYVLNTTKRAI